GLKFNVSCDNLNGDFEPDRLAFMAKVHNEVMSILDNGLPPRVEALSNALREFYQIAPLTKEQFIVQ
ncbi:MAG: elongation factor P hydroxylase, partial [Aliivibrio sp.]|nr:elongation factor P hydroxylase [Aliivibrio sp.]